MQIKRRKFLILGTLLGASPYIKAKEISSFTKEFKKVEATIVAAQEHMFPEGSRLPSASSMNIIEFLNETVMHKSFDRDIKAFVLEGAQELMKREKGHFISLTNIDKEKALRAYEETHYGSLWLSRIMTITMEGMFSDPIYCSNVKKRGWKSLGAYGGSPRPITKYLGT